MIYWTALSENKKALLEALLDENVVFIFLSSLPLFVDIFADIFAIHFYGPYLRDN